MLFLSQEEGSFWFLPSMGKRRGRSLSADGMTDSIQAFRSRSKQNRKAEYFAQELTCERLLPGIKQDALD
jgi:hypothetical protein